MVLKINKKGQFFSPDLVIAVVVFVFGLIIFLNASNSVFGQTQLFDERKEADEVAHSAFNSIILSAGTPADWQNYSINDVSSIGLAYSPNMLDKEKVKALISLLNNSSSYLQVKEKLGFGPYDIYLKITDGKSQTVSDGMLLGGGVIATDPKIKLVYNRVAEYDNNQVLIEAIVSLES